MTLDVLENTPQPMGLLLSQSLSCSRGCFLQLSQKKDTEAAFSFQPVSITKASGEPAAAKTLLSPVLGSRPPVSPGVVKTLGKHGQGKSRVQLQHELLDAAKGALDHSCHLVSSFWLRESAYR